jgi:hypothetical protein
MFETEENCISPTMRAREAMLDWNPSKPLPTNPNYIRYSPLTTLRAPAAPLVTTASGKRQGILLKCLTLESIFYFIFFMDTTNKGPYFNHVSTKAL